MTGWCTIMACRSGPATGSSAPWSGHTIWARERIDLKQALLEETGRDIDVDQDEIMDIVLGRRLWPTTFDFDGLKALWTEFGNEVAAAEEKLAGPGPVEQTLEALLAEARTWLRGRVSRSAGQERLSACDAMRTRAGLKPAPTPVFLRHASWATGTRRVQALDCPDETWRGDRRSPLRRSSRRRQGES